MLDLWKLQEVQTPLCLLLRVRLSYSVSAFCCLGDNTHGNPVWALSSSDFAVVGSLVYVTDFQTDSVQHSSKMFTAWQIQGIRCFSCDVVR
jgi:hypothetical protein